MIPNPYLPHWDERHFREAPPFDPAAAGALKPIEDAGDEALARARVHEVRCPNSHRLIAVYKTREGLVVSGKGALLSVSLRREGGDQVPGPDGEWISQDWHVERRYVRGKFRAAPLRVFLGPRLPHGSVAVYVVQCRCRTADLYAVAITEDIDAGRKKTIYHGEHIRA